MNKLIQLWSNHKICDYWQPSSKLLLPTEESYGICTISSETGQLNIKTEYLYLNKKDNIWENIFGVCSQK